MPEWNTKLAVQYTKGSETVTISPIDSFSPSFSMNIEPLHSVEASHIGAIFSPPTINFSMTVKASFVLQNCLITSAAPTTATISGAPAATFSGFSLAAEVDPKTGDLTKLP
jgi:hypothetical protein